MTELQQSRYRMCMEVKGINNEWTNEWMNGWNEFVYTICTDKYTTDGQANEILKEFALTNTQQMVKQTRSLKK